MIQVQTFSLPDQQPQANEFLKTHKPVGQVHFNTNMIVVFWDNGEYPPEHEIADIQELLGSVKTAKFNQELSLHMLKSDLADLKSTHNKGRYEEVQGAIFKTEDAIQVQDIKVGFLEKRIEELRAN